MKTNNILKTVKTAGEPVNPPTQQGWFEKLSDFVIYYVSACHHSVTDGDGLDCQSFSGRVESLTIVRPAFDFMIFKVAAL